MSSLLHSVSCLLSSVFFFYYIIYSTNHPAKRRAYSCIISKNLRETAFFVYIAYCVLWEYKTLRMGLFTDAEQTLNEYGKQGWEVIDWEDTNFMYFLLKRQL